MNTRPSPAQEYDRIAVAFPFRSDAPPHEIYSQQALTRKLAQILKLDFIEDYRPELRSQATGVYYVPARTLVREVPHDEPMQLPHIDDIRSYDDLYGGIVSHPFVATKAITHPLLHADSSAPEGWQHAFNRETESAVLPGITAFSLKDARLAGLRLLVLGPVRIKPVRASGGRGQILIHDRRQLDEALALQSEFEVTRHGVVLEEHLTNVQTYSVGQVHAGGMDLAYVGTQLLTPDNEASLVYGGSTLLCVRGDYERLLTLPLSDTQREAVRLARLYDAAAKRCYTGLFSSRRNYDVACGDDARGRRKLGVLEQSWRAGGASYAEACALEAFQAMPELRMVSAYTRELYGAHRQIPDDAQIIYQGDDPEIGPVTKYGAVDSHDHPQ